MTARTGRATMQTSWRQADEVDAAEAKDEDRIIAAMGEEISFMTVASAMTVANTLRALAEGEITIRGTSSRESTLPSAGTTMPPMGVSRSLEERC